MKLILSVSILIFSISIFLSGCKTERNADSQMNNPHDLQDQVKQDSAKDIFYDFFFRFAADENYRAGRVKDKKMLNIFFPPESEFTIHIYPADSIDLREFEKDVSTQKIYSVLSADKNVITNYYFLKRDDGWFLDSTDSQKLSLSDDQKFIPFLLKFSEDTMYQKKHIKYPLKSVFLDYNNDYRDTTVYLPQNEVYAVNFLINGRLPFLHGGDILHGDFAASTICFRGRDNGIYIECRFKLLNGVWFMVEEKDFST